MEFGWFHEDESGLAEINITPLVDVALVLLIIFMITAPMLMQGANVQLPQTQPISKLPSGSVFLTVTEEGEIFLNDDDTPIQLADLPGRLSPFAELGEAVFVQGDTAARYGDFMRVLAAVKEAGLDNINLVTEVDPATRR
jgi:biopolymer transport protein TolR